MVLTVLVTILTISRGWKLVTPCLPPPNNDEGKKMKNDWNKNWRSKRITLPIGHKEELDEDS